MPPRVVHLTSGHRPDDMRIVRKELNTLHQAGYPVRLIVPWKGELPEVGFAITTVPPSRSRWTRLLITPWRVAWRGWRLGGDIFHVHEWELIPPSLLLVLLGKKLIYDVHENVLAMAISRPWIPQLLRPITKFIVWIAHLLVSSCSVGIVAATSTIAEQFPAGKTVLVRNFPLLEESAQEELKYDSASRILVYAGGITTERGTREMLQLAQMLPEVTLHLAGEFGDEESRQLVQAATAKKANIVYHGFLGRTEIVSLYHRAGLGLCLLHYDPNYVDALPVKLFEYMSAGLPALTSDFPLWRQIVEDSGCGLVVDPRNVPQILELIIDLFNDPQRRHEMSRRGKAAVIERYNWSSEAKRLIAMYSRIGGMAKTTTATSGSSHDP